MKHDHIDQDAVYINLFIVLKITHTMNTLVHQKVLYSSIDQAIIQNKWRQQ